MSDAANHGQSDKREKLRPRPPLRQNSPATADRGHGRSSSRSWPQKQAKCLLTPGRSGGARVHFGGEFGRGGAPGRASTLQCLEPTRSLGNTPPRLPARVPCTRRLVRILLQLPSSKCRVGCRAFQRAATRPNTIPFSPHSAHSPSYACQPDPGAGARAERAPRGRGSAIIDSK